MKITADTNLLVRAVTGDDPAQARKAAGYLTRSEVVAITLPTLCEFTWVLRRVYGYGAGDVATAIRTLAAAGNAVMNHPAVEAGLTMLEAGGDFADGVIAFQGRWLGGETFVSFDRKAVVLLGAHGQPARVP